MDREYFYSVMQGDGTLPYEHYIQSQILLSCQKNYDDFANEDELVFQVVHQIVELWMKSIAYTLLELDERIQREETNPVVMLFERVHFMQESLIDSLSIMDTISPKSYQGIRQQLGNGSVRESPNYKAIVKMQKPLWKSFKTHYLENRNLTLEDIYDTSYSCSDTYRIAEAFVKYDELFQKFRFYHIQLIHRTIGPNALSLKGNPVASLNDGLRSKLFPELWAIRGRMTDAVPPT